MNEKIKTAMRLEMLKKLQNDELIEPEEHKRVANLFFRHADIANLQIAIHANAVEKGFWDNEEHNHTGNQIMLIVGELAEAHESVRKERYYSDKINTTINDERVRISGLRHKLNQVNLETFRTLFELFVKDTFEDELADALIRIHDLAGSRGMNLQWHVKAKMLYNSTRPKLHGDKKF